MAADLSISQAAAKAMCDTLVDLIDVGGTGTLVIRSGTRPATTDTAVTGTLLATLTFSATAFGAATTASPSVATAAAITSDSSADATATATWFRIFAGNGTTAIMDGNVGTSGEDLNLNTTSIVTGAVVSISAGTISMPVT